MTEQAIDPAATRLSPEEFADRAPRWASRTTCATTSPRWTP